MSESDWPAHPGQVPVLDTRVGGKALHADPRAITFGRKSLALDQVEWVSYWVTHTATKRFLFPTTHSTEWHFEVGGYPYYGGPKLGVSDFMLGRRDDLPESWHFLVNLSRHYLEPRLLSDLVTRIHNGETITIAGSLQVSLHGIACPRPRFSVPWQSILPPQPDNGMIWIYQPGADEPLVNVPLSHPNALLVPALFGAFMT